MTAKVIRLHRPRTCLGCKHFSTGETETVEPRCVEWDQPLDDESVGATCPDYQPGGHA